jgi:hypothetical protein
MRQLWYVTALIVMTLILVGCGRFSDRIEPIPTEEQSEAAPQQMEETPAPEEETVEATEEQPIETPTEEATATEAPEEVETPEETPEVTPTEEPEAGAAEGQENEPETPPVEPVVIDMAAAPDMTFNEGWEQVYALEAGYPFELTVTEEQLKTALVANSDLPNVSDIIVQLDNGLIMISFTIQLDRVSPQAQVILIPSVADGDVVLTVQSVTVGAFSLPEEIVDEISAGLQMAMNGAREEIAAEYSVRADVTAITVDDDIMTISGTLVPK